MAKVTAYRKQYPKEQNFDNLNYNLWGPNILGSIFLIALYLKIVHDYLLKWAKGWVGYVLHI